MSTRLAFFVSIIFFSSCTKVYFTEPQNLGSSSADQFPAYLQDKVFSATNEENTDSIIFKQNGILLNDGKFLSLTGSKDTFQFYSKGNYAAMNYRDKGAAEWECVWMFAKTNGDVNLYYPWHSWKYKDIQISEDQNIIKSGQLSEDEIVAICNDSNNLVGILGNAGEFNYLFDMQAPNSSVTVDEIKVHNKKAAKSLLKLIKAKEKEQQVMAEKQANADACCLEYYNHVYTLKAGNQEKVWAVVVRVAYEGSSYPFEIQPCKTETNVYYEENGDSTVYKTNYFLELIELKKGVSGSDHFTIALENIIPGDLAQELMNKKLVYYDLEGYLGSNYENEKVTFDEKFFDEKIKSYLHFNEPIDYYARDCQAVDSDYYNKKNVKSDIKNYTGRRVGEY